jgi:hypothetical protein
MMAQVYAVFSLHKLLRMIEMDMLMMLFDPCLNLTPSLSDIHLSTHTQGMLYMPLQQGDTLSPFLFNFSLEYANRRVQENQEGLKLNGTHQLLAYADNINIVVKNVDTMQKNAEALCTSKEVGLEVNPEKTKYMLMSNYQKAGQKHGVKIPLKMWQILDVWEQHTNRSELHAQRDHKQTKIGECLLPFDSVFLSSNLLENGGSCTMRSFIICTHP